MPKPDNRATRRLKKATGTMFRLEHREEPPCSTPTWWRRKIKAVVEIISVASAVLAITFAVHDALQEPQVHAQTAQTSTPFSLYFSIHNPSLIFTMSDVRIQCTIDDVTTDKYFRFEKFNVSANEGVITIPPGKTGQYNCPFDKAVLEAGPIQTARIILALQFKTMSIERRASSEMLNWNSVSKQWVEGQIIK
jgi:hypothetical protein